MLSFMLASEDRPPNRQVDKEVDKKHDYPKAANNRNGNPYDHTRYGINSNWFIDKWYEGGGRSNPHNRKE